MELLSKDIIETYKSAAAEFTSEQVSDQEAKEKFIALLKKSDIAEVYKRLRDK